MIKKTVDTKIMFDYINHDKAILKIAEKLDMDKKVVRSIVESFILRTRDAVRQNKTVEIRGFGTFKPNARGRVFLRRIAGKKKATMLEIDRKSKGYLNFKRNQRKDE